jgi:hypothetical protein
MPRSAPAVCTRGPLKQLLPTRFSSLAPRSCSLVFAMSCSGPPALPDQLLLLPLALADAQRQDHRWWR